MDAAVRTGVQVHKLTRFLLLKGAARCLYPAYGAFAAFTLVVVIDEFFVGRTGELARLEGLLAEVAGGVGGAVLVEGEQGIGKTALLRQALGGAGAAGCALAWGAADELGQRFPLWLMTECLGRAGSWRGVTGTWMGRMARAPGKARSAR